MKRCIPAAAVAFAVSVAGTASWAQTNPTDPAAAATKAPAAAPTAALTPGFYEGKLEIQAGLALTLIFNIQSAGDRLSSTLSVPEQNAKDVPVPTTTFKNRELVIDMPALQAKYVGKLAEDGKTVKGTFTQAGMSLPLTLERKAVPTAFKRPQDPKPPFPYQTEDVTYPNPKATGVTLAGTLTLPEGAGPFPTALFISGSGPQDRDEGLLGHRPFAVIADYLARRGIASLRVDDRGVAKSTGSFATATSADFASDVRAGVAFLKTRKGVDPKKIGLIGHSEGGLIAPMVAADTPEVAFIVLLAGPGVDGRQILMAQQQLIGKAMGANDAELARGRAFNDRVYATIQTEKDNAKLNEAVGKLAKEFVASLPEDQRKGGAEKVEASLKMSTTPWFRYFLTYDPAPTLKQVRCPVLAINGEKDLQVPPKQNLPAIEAAVKAGGNKDVTTREMPGLNHLFQTSKTGAPSEYAGIEETFSPDALKTVGDWIAAHTGAK